MREYIIVGCDLHDATMVLKVAHQLDEPMTRTILNDAAGRIRMIGWLRELAARHGEAGIVFAYEASCLGFGLHDELSGAGIACHVLAPTKIERSTKGRRHKNDDRDAARVFELLRGHVLAGNELPSVWVPDHATRDDRELVRMRLRLGEQMTQTKAQVQTLLKRNALVRSKHISAWTKLDRSWLAELARGQTAGLGGGARSALGSLLRQLRLCERECLRLDRAVHALAKSDRYSAMALELEEYSGVGTLTAMVFLTEIGDVNRFGNRRQLASFLGVVPASHESGKANDRKGHITHQGPGRVRKVLCQAVWSGLRGDGPESRWFRQYVARHPKRKKVATVAAMRRLAIRLWHSAREALPAAPESAAPAPHPCPISPHPCRRPGGVHCHPPGPPG